MKKYFLLVFLAFIIFIAGCSSSGETVIDTEKLANCLTDNGAIFYGSSTCPHCTEQKAMFGEDVDKINYVECSVERERCADEDIQFLPTWKFADGDSVVGTKSLEYLAEKVGCKI